MQNVCQHEKRTDLKVGHVGSETRSLDQTVDKSCALSSWHSFDPVCMKLCQNVFYHKISNLKILELGQVGSKSRSLDQILEKTCFFLTL